MMNRREFLRAGSVWAGLGCVANLAADGRKSPAEIMTVTGPIAASDAGRMLAHEHVLVDFIGADKVSRDRYNTDEVAEIMLPYLKRVRKAGCRTLVECTPAYLGRDPLLLKRLSEASGVQLVTNTGYYGAVNDKFLPPHAFSETAQQLATRWLEEWRSGIEGTSIRPGFIKIAVDKGPLSPVDRKLVQAAALTHLQSGLTIASHTTDGKAALEQLAILRQESASPSAWIWVHAHTEKDPEIHVQAARAGAWLEFDGINPKSVERHVELVLFMKGQGLLDHVLVSQDAGWYHVGEPRGGKVRPYDTLFDEFLPALRKAGLTEQEIGQVIEENPQKAFSVHVRMLRPED